ncbi:MULTISPECIES: TIGR04222 domain-containing membrane protein [unclassified Pseudonocardia]|uniref:TIGR04222 domain-containing membrane protein n=1 Tax=unclassified Pseudonocardia TaxID=2619320 RepID=UPI001CF679B1|nr:TIGR04222 domain-containing membrane protein [Pseudonocardia sp. ICBG162]
MGTNLTGDTWGIPGQTFLVLYVVALVLVSGIVLRRRRTIAQGDPRGARTLDSRPEDVAYLNGGPELAVYAALSAMHVDGSLVTSGRTTGQVRAGRVPGHGASALQRAIHRSAQRLTPGRMLGTHEPVRTELARAAQRLETAGLLLSPADRVRYRATAWPVGVLALAGAVRIAAGLGGGRPVGFLFALVAATAVFATVLATRVPDRTRAGDAALTVVRSRNDALSPSMRPDWTAVGPAAAALSVGAFGVGAMLAAEPAFAEELAAQKLATLGGAPAATGGGSSDGGGVGWSGGDGGGSSCGGGGGGCGGGGCGG